MIHFFRDGAVIVDEIDLVMHPMTSELNFPVGDKDNARSDSHSSLVLLVHVVSPMLCGGVCAQRLAQRFVQHKFGLPDVEDGLQRGPLRSLSLCCSRLALFPHMLLTPCPSSSSAVVTPRLPSSPSGRVLTHQRGAARGDCLVSPARRAQGRAQPGAHGAREAAL